MFKCNAIGSQRKTALEKQKAETFIVSKGLVGVHYFRNLR
jgi:hypothetical protein